MRVNRQRRITSEQTMAPSWWRSPTVVRPLRDDFNIWEQLARTLKKRGERERVPHHGRFHELTSRKVRGISLCRSCGAVRLSDDTFSLPQISATKCKSAQNGLLNNA
jgi:hypothetical protein